MTCGDGAGQLLELSGRGRFGPGLPPARKRDRGGQPAADGPQCVGPAWCQRDSLACPGLPGLGDGAPSLEGLPAPARVGAER